LISHINLIISQTLSWCYIFTGFYHNFTSSNDKTVSSWTRWHFIHWWINGSEGRIHCQCYQTVITSRRIFIAFSGLQNRIIGKIDDLVRFNRTFVRNSKWYRLSLKKSMVFLIIIGRAGGARSQSVLGAFDGRNIAIWTGPARSRGGWSGM